MLRPTLFSQQTGYSIKSFEVAVINEESAPDSGTEEENEESEALERHR
jgi:hypothetical protein